MSDIKGNIAKNITELRLLNNMTQLELAEKLNYSDKTISKWEREESSPDISVLVEIANIFGVTLDYLVSDGSVDEKVTYHIKKEKEDKNKYNYYAIMGIAQGLVWAIALTAFVITALISTKASFEWLYFIYALPITQIIHLVFNSIWFNPRRNYVIISFLMWSILATIHLTFWYFHINIGLIYLLGILGQIIIILWSLIKKPKKFK